MKIVSLLPAATEILCDMGLAEYISAVSHECDYPSIVKNKIKITSSIIPNNSDQNAIDKLVKEAYKRGKAINAASTMEIDEVIDPKNSRVRISTAINSYCYKKERVRKIIDSW